MAKAKKKAVANNSIPGYLETLASAEIFSPKLNQRIYVPFIDLWLYGALSHGKMISIIGDPGVGKSTLTYRTVSGMLRTCKDCMTPALSFKKDKKTKYTCKCGHNNFMTGILVDSEDRVTEPYLALQGIETGTFTHYDHKGMSIRLNTQHKNTKNGQLVVMKYQFAEAMYDYLCDVVKEGHVDFVVMDSLSATATESAVVSYKRDLGQLARLNTYGLRSLQTAINSSSSKFNKPVTVLWTNHMQEKIGGFARPGMVPKAQAGGRAPKYYQAQSIELTRSAINPENLTKQKYGKLDHQYVREYSFVVRKNTVGTPENYKGDFSIWTDSYELPSGKYAPGDTGEDGKIFKACTHFNLYYKSKSKYHLLGFEEKKAGDLVKYLKNEAIQYEARYWLAQVALPDLARHYLKLEDFTYDPFLDKKRVERVGVLVDELRSVLYDGESADEKDAGQTDDRTKEEIAEEADFLK